jgi:hypothetical protein
MRPFPFVWPTSKLVRAKYEINPSGQTDLVAFGQVAAAATEAEMPNDTEDY